MAHAILERPPSHDAGRIFRTPTTAGCMIGRTLRSVRLWMYVVAVALRVPTMGQSLTVWHGWRQTQTAFTARMYQEHGIDLLRPQVPVFGRPFVLVYELPLFQAMAAVVSSFGVGLEHALRWTSLFWFVVTAILLRAVLVRAAGRRFAFPAEFLFLFSPFGLFWSRASLMEYLATALALGYVLAALRWRDRGRTTNLLASVVVGAGAAMVKSTTALIWMVPLTGALLIPTGPLVARGSLMVRTLRNRIAGLVIISVSVLTAGAGWSAWGDHLKRASPLTEPTTTGSVLSDNRAAWPHLLTRIQWAKPFDMVVNHQLGGLAVLIGVLVALRRCQDRSWWWSLAVMPPIAVLAFPVQYMHHEYYNAAASPAVAALSGFAAVRLLDSQWAATRPHLLRAPVLVAVWLLMAGMSGYQSIALVRLANSDPSVRNQLELSQELLQHTSPEELIGGIGLNTWSPIPLYEGQRRGAIMVEPDQAAVFAAEFRDGGYHVALVGHPQLDDLTVLEGWPWLGAVSGHILRFGDTRSHLRDAQVMSITNPRGSELASRFRTLGGSAILKCDGAALRLPIADAAMALWFSAPNLQQRFWIDERWAALPVRTLALIAPPSPGHGERHPVLHCLGGGILRIDRITTFE